MYILIQYITSNYTMIKHKLTRYFFIVSNDLVQGRLKARNSKTIKPTMRSPHSAGFLFLNTRQVRTIIYLEFLKNEPKR